MQGISVFDWKIYQHLFSAAEMETVFAEANSIACWIEVERATARAQAKVSIIPENAAREIDEKLCIEALDLDQLRVSTRKIGRPIAGLIEQLKQQVSAEAGEWVHFGVTTYDIMDTGRSLQLRKGLSLIEASLTAFRLA